MRAVANPVMTHPTPHTLLGCDPRAGDIVAWRRRRLVQAGFDAQLAQALAADRRSDLHALLQLVDRGCPPRLAARILAPLDPPEPPR